MFVSLFRPMRIAPNGLDPTLHDLDEFSVPHLFTNCLSSPSSHSSSFSDVLVEGDIEISIELSEAGSIHVLSQCKKYTVGLLEVGHLYW